MPLGKYEVEIDLLETICRLVYEAITFALNGVEIHYAKQ
jgi:hypothetical protein